MAHRKSLRRPPPVEAPKIRIVVADDHPIFRDGLCRLLALEPDFEVVAQAQDGRQVLDVLQQYEPDILLLDLKMPGLDGLATLQRLQTSKHKTRVIVLTASEDKNEFVQAMKLGTVRHRFETERHGSADQEHPQSECRRDLAGFAHHRRRHAPVRHGRRQKHRRPALRRPAAASASVPC